MDRLDKLLSIYTYQPFPSRRQEEWIRRVWTEKGKEIGKTLIYIGPSSYPLVKARPSLTNRFPVYFGKPLWEAFDSRKVKTYFGYDPHKKIIPPRSRYVIGGEVEVVDENFRPLRSAKGQSTWILHTWGINLETYSSPDYHRFMTYEDRLKRIAYGIETTSYLTKVMRGVRKIMARTNNKEATLVMPLIGLGAYLNVVWNEEDREFARQTFLGALRDVASRCPGVEILLADYSGVFEGQPSSKGLTLVHGNGDRKFGKNPADLFYILRSQEEVPLLIGLNAWDSLSYIGNGMANDPTIDGFLVAGKANGRFWRNTSYLHNPLLHL